jgi:hypothetical protein
MIDVNIYKSLGNELGAIAEDWDTDSLIADNVEVSGSIAQHHQVAIAALVSLQQWHISNQVLPG